MNTESKLPEEEQKEQQTRLLYAELCDILPGIGFFSHKKRLNAYITVTKKAQAAIIADSMTDAEVLFVLSMLVRKNNNFQKSAITTALSLEKYKTRIAPIGVKFANEVRANMGQLPIPE